MVYKYMAKRKKPGSANRAPSRLPKVAIYIRVSTSYQVDKDSLPMQRKDLTAYSELILGIDNYEIFEDAGYSGKNTDRPAFQEMMTRIRKGEFTYLLVWKIDRISRNLLDFAEMYEELQFLRVTFVSKNEQFDTSTAIGEAMLKIILVFAELERNMTSERVTATMISRANSGLWNGGRIPFGYSYDSETQEFHIDEDQAEICRILKDKYLETRSMVITSRFLNSQGYRTRSGAEWSPVSVCIIVSSPFYTGTYRYNRYKGTENRTENPEDEWVLIEGHHPAIFTQEEYDRMTSIREENARSRNRKGQQHSVNNVHIFQRIVYCGKCGSRMVSTPGRLYADGTRMSNYSCPHRRRTKNCDNQTISDTIIGEFVINYILNMLNAKISFSSIDTPEDLQKRLLLGQPFKGIDHIDPEGLHNFFNILSRYGSDRSYKFTVSRPKKKAAEVDPEVTFLRKEKERQERALKRLQDLYLYSADAMSEKDFIIRKKEITDKLEEISSKLGLVNRQFSAILSDEDFVRQASHLLIQKELKNRTYIYFRQLAKNVSPEILHTYMSTILDAVYVVDAHVTQITFKNGLTHRFIWK